ncbi:Sec-independent protein translocase protein TatB [Dyella lutea]|uniref:Sec-independent protein translocase protein TatB n=1 Tax=Dyella lutea TaxID=2950441 RepID=A0ABT1F9X4_9GAMM|nr:Sec-independent protein translocase protein TatB [Dyella lutea]MCP1373112.1 Sec-independent protein translocase protein TatB [Dyella lutea]
MIEISFGKLLLLAVIALIVLGPEKLPVAARTAGTLLRRLRSGWDSVRAEVERELQVEEIRRAAREAAAQAEAAQARLNEVQSKVDEAARQAGKVAAPDVSTLADAPVASPAPDEPALMTGKPKDDPSTPPQDEVPRGQG